MSTTHRPLIVFLAAVSAVLIQAGCAQLPAQCTRQIEQAKTALDRGKYGQCRQLLDPIIRKYPKHEGAAEAYYVRGLALLHENQRRKSYSDFERAESLAKERELRGWIEVQLGNFAFDDTFYAQAAGRYVRAEPDLPHRPPTDVVLYRLGISMIRNGDFATGREYLVRMIMDYPKSPLVADARHTLSWDGDYLTVQCGAFDRVENAHTAAARLRQHDIHALAFADPRSATKRYVVRVGRYDSYREASSMLARVQRYHSDAFILP